MKCVHLLTAALVIVTGCAWPLPAKPARGPSASPVSVDWQDVQYEGTLAPKTPDQEQALSGMTYAVVKLTVHNSQAGPLVLTSAMFALSQDRNTYSPQTGHVLEALESTGRRSILFKPLAAGQDTSGFLVFQVPITSQPPATALRFRFSPHDQVSDLTVQDHR